jgi:hypothetical protein
MRNIGKDNKARELKLWLFYAIKVQNNYLMFTPLNRQRCLDEPLRGASLDKLTQDLANKHEETISKLVEMKAND